jgi:hypothetical protein
MCNGLISKILLFSINFILLLGGIAVLTIGALGLSDPTVVENLYSYVFKATDFKLADLVNLSDLVIAPCIVMICIGSVVIHCYADDGQLYISSKAGAAESSIELATACINQLDRWMSSNRLKLNSDKTQLIWLGSRQQLLKVNPDSILLGASTVRFQSSVVDLGIVLDSNLSMRDHVSRLCRTSYYQLRQLRVIRQSLTTRACTQLVHALVNSRLDYCNSLLSGITDQLLSQLQSVLRASARLVLQRRKFDPVSNDIREKLH